MHQSCSVVEGQFGKAVGVGPCGSLLETGALEGWECLDAFFGGRETDWRCEIGVLQTAPEDQGKVAFKPQSCY